MEEAVSAEVPEANAMCLCTQGEDGFPDGRMVLLKGVNDSSLYFYTNYGSRKGEQLQSCPRATAVFWWEPLHRQVRLTGVVEKAEPETSSEYFHSRPRDSKLGAWASRQSQPVEGREVLEARLEEMDRRFPEDVPRPEFWGGFLLRPHRVEFWQGRSNRLHDRFVYHREKERGWTTERLMP